ncbi:cation-transporting atpase [Anaeramoeba ignava]|uniref:Cation-transporting ATPase n=1 Tax=Anaeramoeba ignava TaxID=1746090 RepID=A0A9Q0R8D4_ANAIG|nr:cation-transporting atpase [Anaeramoeba ignava]
MISNKNSLENESLIEKNKILKKIEKKDSTDEKNTHQIFDIADDGSQITCYLIFYKRSYIRTTFFVILAILTVGLSLLFFHWFPKLKLKSTHRKVLHINHADRFLILRDDKTFNIVKKDHVQLIDQKGNNYQRVSFQYRFINYLQDTTTQTFQRVEFEMNKNFREILSTMSNGINDKNEIKNRKNLFGQNLINVPVKSYIGLLLDEILNPLFVFQVFAILVWSLEDYYYYAVCIFLISSFAAIMGMLDAHRNLENLQKMARHECFVNVFRNGEFKEISSKKLVPGDVIEIPNNFILPGDFILLNGQCIVNESMLTGESTPVIKTSLPNDPKQIYDILSHKKYTLYSGTKVIQSRFYSGNRVLAMVVRTSFNTMKGSLVRSILFPKPHNFKFYRDTFKFLIVMAIIAVIGFIVSTIFFLKLGVSVSDILVRAGDLITIVVPPELPIVMTTGASFAIMRLKKIQIYCISPPRINVSGKINFICFDKTGTLTTDGLEVLCVRPTSQNKFSSEQTHIDSTFSNVPSKMLHVMACCHSLSRVDGEIIGDPLEIQMFQFTGWEFQEIQSDENTGFDTLISTIVYPPKDSEEKEANSEDVDSEQKSEQNSDDLVIENPDANLALTANNPSTEFGIVKTFDFSSNLQRMSVIVQQTDIQSLELHVKGSPEQIRILCDENSIPKNYSSVLDLYTKEGYRVIALAYRELPEVDLSDLDHLLREEVEKDLIFLGFLVLENKLKPDTKDVIIQLNDSRFESVMATGDNPLTAISVSKKCNLIHPTSVVFLSERRNGKIRWVNVDNHNQIFDLEKNQIINLKDDEISLSDSEEVDISKGETIKKENNLLVSANDIELVIIGEHFFEMKKNHELFEKMLIQTHIFARMTPENKSQLIQEYQEIGYVVGMCGDGANDVKALKAAHIGVSLAETEASIAAPFTSKRQTIQSFVDVVREGRCSLVSSFQAFKFVALYALIQFVGVVQLYLINSNLGDWQYLYVDMFMVLPLSIFMSRTGAAKRLVRRRPTASLVSASVLTSLVLHLILIFGFQYVSLELLKKQSFYSPLEASLDSDNILCYETTTIFLVSNFQYLFVLIAVNRSKPFKKSVFTNRFLLVTIILLVLLSFYLLLFPDSFIRGFMQMEKLDWNFKFILLALCLFHLVLAYFMEQFVTSPTFKKQDSNLRPLDISLFLNKLFKITIYSQMLYQLSYSENI